MRITAGLLFFLTLCSSWATKVSGFTDNDFAVTADTRCQVSVTGQAIDYGTQTRWQLKEASGGEGRLTPGKRTLRLNAICPYALPLQFFVQGASAPNGDIRYGERGSLRMMLSEASVDSSAVQIARTAQNLILTGKPQPALLIKPNEGFSAILDGQVARAKYFSALLEIEPQIMAVDTRVSAPEVSESNFTIQLIN